MAYPRYPGPFPGPMGFPMGFGFAPPSPEFLMQFLMQSLQQKKQDAQDALNKNQLPAALTLYTEALHIAQRHFPGHEEIPKLLSNRALVFLKQRNFKSALQDCRQCCYEYPLWIKGFWRHAQAYKGLGENYEAVKVLIQGWENCSESPIDERVSLFAEIVTTVLVLTDDPYDHLDSVEPPIEDHIQVKVLQRLISNGCWEAVSLLVIGEHRGPISCLDESFSTCPAESLSIGGLVQSLSNFEMRKWGLKLLITLLKNGASYKDMEYKVGKPAIHIGVELSLNTGTTDLLKQMFAQYLTTEERKNAVDKNKESAFHALIHSGKANGTLGETILRMLLNNGCNPHMRDAALKLAKDYLKPVELAHSILMSAPKAPNKEDIKERIEKLKEEGNTAHRTGDNQKANQAYTQALQLIESHGLPRVEAAVFLSNRSAVQNALGNTTKALQDAEESVWRDPSWHKGHWRRGQLLRQLEKHREAYFAFLDGYSRSETCTDPEKINFLVEAVISFPNITDIDDKNKCYAYLWRIPRDDTWQTVLYKLSKQGEWLAIRYLVLGVQFNFIHGQNPYVRSEGAAACVDSSLTKMQMSTFLPFLRRHGEISKLKKWAMPLVFFILTSLPEKIYGRGKSEMSPFIDLSEDEEDTPLNGMIKFCAIIGDVTVVQVVKEEYLRTWKFQDINGDTPYHAMYKMPQRPRAEHLLVVTQFLLTRKFSINTKDGVGHLPLHYLKPEDGELYRLVQKSTSAALYQTSSSSSSINKDPVRITMQDILQLKKNGNDAFHLGRYPEAIQHYSDAICALELVKTKEPKGHHFAVLYGNRAECHLKLEHNAQARKDAVESVSYDGHWYKAHLRVGRAQAACGNIEMAYKAIRNSFSSIGATEPDSVRREVLGELAKYAEKTSQRQQGGNTREKLATLKGVKGEIWALVSYDLIVSGQYNAALEAYHQFQCNEAKIFPVWVDLRVLCKLELLEKDTVWIIDLTMYFLHCGNDHTQLSLQRNDTYLHAVVRMTLVSGNLSLLKYLIDNQVKQRGEINMVDDKGNTALHAALRESRIYHPMVRLKVCHILVQDGDIDTLRRNKDGKVALEYIPMGEGQLAEFLLSVMNSQEGLDKEIKRQQSLKEEAERKKRQEMERKKQEIERKKQEELEKKKKEEMERKHQYEKSNLFQSRSKEGTQKNASARGQSTEYDQRTKKEPPKQQSKVTLNEHCNQCKELYDRACELLEESKTKSYSEFAKVLTKKHNSQRHKKMEEDILGILIKNIGKVLNPEIPERLAKIPLKFYERLVGGLASNEKWLQMDIAVHEYRRHHGDLALRDFAKTLSVAKVISNTSVQDQQLVVQIVKNMLQSGAELSHEGKLAVLGAVQEYRFKVLEVLFKEGAHPRHLTLVPGDTPMHAALSIALERDKGNFTILNLFFEIYEEDPEKYPMLDPSKVDSNGNSLFHIVAQAKYNATAQKATELLCDKKVSAMVYNNEGKLPKDYLNKKNDRRLQFFRLASVSGSTEKTSNRKTKEKKSPEPNTSQSAESEKVVPEVAEDNNNSNNNNNNNNNNSSSNLKNAQPFQDRKSDRALPVKVSQRRELVKSHIEDMIYSLPDIPYSIFNPRQANTVEDNTLKKIRQKLQLSREEAVKKEQPEQEEENQKQQDERGEQNVAYEEEEDEDDDDVITEEEEDFQFDPQVFDNLEWEIECTAEVWRTLRDKHVLPDLKQRVIRKIQLLGKGEWRPHLCKELKNVPETLKLYEAKLSKGGRILWELAVAFSPRLSETAERRLQMGDSDKEQPVRGGRIYSEIIRVWDVVFDHDKIYRCVQRIIKSHHRGEECIIQKKLQGIKQRQFQGGVTRRIPMIFTEMDSELNQEEIQERQQELQKFFPPASSNETEYHILKFYAFSSNLVIHVLQNLEMKVDFPFRVTDLEHAIINLQSNAPILLLGRSGTGKTTCCLYRLWSQFVSYWTTAKKAECKLLPRCVVYREDNEEEVEDEGAEEVEDVEEDEETEEEGEPAEAEGADGEEENAQEYDHLQQIFITKNSVLCAEVQKNFRELSHACDLAKDHVAMEAQGIPHRLQDVNEYQYPLFITSRQLLLMLDATLEPPYFFERNENGSMRVDIQGWSDSDGPLAFHPLMDNDSDEEEDENFDEAEIDEDLDLEDEVQQRQTRRQRVDPRREVTYQIFAEEVWPHISKKYSGKYHPSLVWMEIMSFIKGSFEALSKASGSLNKKEYLSLGKKRAPNFSGERDHLSLGKKRAPNFSGERDHIYQIFLQYEHFKKQKFLFDETDLVRNVYSRLKKEKSLKWIIHQIYVDETQDFTQAELCLLLHICNNPNQMFLTGDTAQSIMRGISFRFNDLRSLFFYARNSMHAVGKTSAVEVPKQVYQLTHNYRSHAGILSLASSILDLMIEFFPESFDRLGKDQGLFQGPAPVLLESCSFSDLAMLLRGNKRKTSHIEFGAHQAILVVNDAARDNIPEELQLGLILTIYEAKGLEFDDILLYNFFHDSQANKEWRVITEFLEKLYTSHTEKTHVTSSLMEFDSDVLQLSGRPRALAFDPNQHKVLNSELKHLYTAVTRARVNVWIFDSHMEKRAPMFEYFKARKLVRSITSDDVDGVSGDGVFAEESTSDEWIKRGEDFMKHSLYEVAAKCFLRGGDQYMQSVAVAHQKALNASRMKDNPSRMREEFLYAAESFLDCELPAKAVICLQNARERELVAHLYEKIGQLDRAAETYRRLRRPVEGSRCYEQLGKFNLAVETLYENEMYDMAIDTLQRHKMLMQELRRKGKDIPQVLIQERPRKHHSIEQLSYKAAEFYHKARNVDRMMAALSRLPNLEDQTSFLTKRNYRQKAAQLLENKEQYEKASDLYLEQGLTKEALECARKSGHKLLIGRALLIDATLAVRKHKKHEDLQALDDICQNLETAFNLFQIQEKKDDAGEAALLRGQITGKIIFINKAFGAFSRALPKNEAGMLECMDWMVTNSNLLDSKNYYANVKQVIKGMENLFGILRVLLHQANEQEKVRAEGILKFYGVSHTADRLYLVLCPQQKPMALKMLRRVMSEKDRKSVRCEISRDVALPELCKFLIDRGKEWKERIDVALSTIRESRCQCPDYTLGRPCQRSEQVKEEESADGSESESSSEQTECPNFHCEFSYDRHNELLETDEWMIEHDYYMRRGCADLKALASDEVQEQLCLDRFVQGGIEIKYKSCLRFLNDLLPNHCYLGVATDTMVHARELKGWFSSRKKWFRDSFSSYLQEFYFYMKKENRKANTKFFVRLLFLHHLMDIKVMDEKPSSIMTKFEREIFDDFTQKIQSVDKLRKTVAQLGFISDETFDEKTGKKGLHVECLSHRFYDAFDKLTSLNNDPWEALIAFSKFMTMLGKEKKTIMPFPSDLLLWLEFFTTVTMSIMAKTYKGGNFLYVLPESYISIVHLVDASFIHRQGVPTFEAIQRFQPWRGFFLDQVPKRLGYITKLIWSSGSNWNLICHYFKTNTTDGCMKEEHYGIAERVLVLALVCLCNVGYSVDAEKESMIMMQLCKVQIREQYPPRLCRALRAVQQAESQQDLATALKTLLIERENERLLHCEWRGGRYGIWHDSLDVELLCDDFYNHKTITYRKNPFLAELEPEAVVQENMREEEIQEDLSITMEEKMKRERQHEEEIQREARENAAFCITRLFRKLVLRKRCSKLKCLLEKLIMKEKQLRKTSVFQSVTIDYFHCGICGVFFDTSRVEEEVRGGSGAENVWKSGLELQNPPVQRQTSLPNQFDESFARARESRRDHEESGRHKDMVKVYKMFCFKFIRELSEDYDQVTDFMEKFRLTESGGRYPDFTFNIERLLRVRGEADAELKRIVDDKDWTGSQKFVEKIKEMKEDFLQIKTYVEDTAKEYKKTMEKKREQAASLEAVRPSPAENWEDELDEVVEVVEDPSLRKSRAIVGKGRGRGRGRKKDKQ